MATDTHKKLVEDVQSLNQICAELHALTAEIRKILTEAADSIDAAATTLEVKYGNHSTAA